MVDGIRIVEENVVKDPTALMVVFVVLVVGVGVLAIMKNNGIIAGIWAFIYVVCVVAVLTKIPPFYKTATRHEYKCVLDNDMPATYLEENFTNIRFEDGLWVFEDKED